MKSGTLFKKRGSRKYRIFNIFLSYLFLTKFELTYLAAESR